MSHPVLQVVIGSTRPQRVGEPVAEWFAEEARTHGGFALEVTDLRELALPLLDEPEHPRLGHYSHEHTRRWSEIVSHSSAFVFVVPEYNHSFNAATKNALDYLSSEWADKPVGFVSYGGVSGGTRAVTALKPVVAALRMIPVVEAVNIPFVTQFVKDGHLAPNDTTKGAAKSLLDELVRWVDLSPRS